MSFARFLTFLGLAFPLFCLDYFTKAWALSHIQPVGEIPIFQNFFGIDFSLRCITNGGGPWGILSSLHGILPILRIMAILFLIAYLFFAPRAVRYHFPLTLILVGALGNVVDFFAYGHVIDLLHFTFWGHSYPVFNIADSAIFLGVMWMVLRPNAAPALPVR